MSEKARAVADGAGEGAAGGEITPLDRRFAGLWAAEGEHFHTGDAASGAPDPHPPRAQSRRSSAAGSSSRSAIRSPSKRGRRRRRLRRTPPPPPCASRAPLWPANPCRSCAGRRAARPSPPVPLQWRPPCGPSRAARGPTLRPGGRSIVSRARRNCRPRDSARRTGVRRDSSCDSTAGITASVIANLSTEAPGPTLLAGII